MSSNEFNILRLKVLEKEIDRLNELIKEKEYTLSLESERHRGIVTELEVELDKFKEDDKN